MNFYNVQNENYLGVIKSQNYVVYLKVELLDHQENVMSEISREVSLDTSGSINVDYQQGVRRTCSLTLNNIGKQFLPNENSIVWINQKFKLWLGVGVSSDVYWFAQGVYIIKSLDVSPNTVQIEGVDKFGFFTEDLNQHCLQGTYEIPYNTSTYNALTSTLAMDMGNGKPIDPILPLVDLSMKKEILPYTITKDEGGFLGDILTEMATSLNADIFYDTNGVLNVSKSKVDTYIKEAPIFYFDCVEPNIADLNVKYDLGEIVNVCKVYGTDIDEVIHSYVAKNTNPKSPTRISLIGEKADAPEESDMCYDDKHCHDYAHYQLNQKSAVAMSVSFNTPIIPHLDVNRIISITSDYFNFKQEDCLVTSLNIPIGLGTMSISACNIKYLPAYPISDII